MTSDLSPRLRAVSTLGIITSTYLASSILIPNSRNPIPLLTLLSTFSFGFLTWNLLGTLEQRRAELFGLATFLVGLAAIPVPSFLVRAQTGAERGREEDEKDGTGIKWGKWCKAGLPLAGALIGAWAGLGAG